MEIELKYSIRSDRIADDIFKDEYLKTIEEPNTAKIGRASCRERV